MESNLIEIEVAPGPASLASPNYRKIQAVVDPEVVTMSVPEKLASELGLRKLGTRTVYRGNSEKKVDVVGGLWIKVGNRKTYVDANVEPGPVRFGFSPQAALDLVVEESDSGVSLVPRDPSKIVHVVK